MRVSRQVEQSLGICCVLSLVACDVQTERPVTRSESYTENLPPLEGAPAAFVVDTAAGGPRPVAIGESPQRLSDPSGKVQLRISESRTSSRRQGDTTVVRSYGDYFVEPAGSYGVGMGETIRMDCGRAAPVGIVR